MTKDTKDVATRSKPGTTKKTQLIRMLSTRTGAEVAAISGKLGNPWTFVDPGVSEGRLRYRRGQTRSG